MLAAQLKDAVEEFRAILEEGLPDRVRRVVVFGPWARGENVPSSPVKVLVIVSDASGPERLWIADLGKSMLTEIGLTMDPTVLSAPQWDELAKKQGYFVREVARGGIEIGPSVAADQSGETIARRHTA